MNSLSLKEKLFPKFATNQTISESLFTKKRLLSFSLSLLQLIALFLILGNLSIEKGSGIEEVNTLPLKNPKAK